MIQPIIYEVIPPSNNDRAAVQEEIRKYLFRTLFERGEFHKLTQLIPYGGKRAKEINHILLNMAKDLDTLFINKGNS